MNRQAGAAMGAGQAASLKHFSLMLVRGRSSRRHDDVKLCRVGKQSRPAKRSGGSSLGSGRREDEQDPRS